MTSTGLPATMPFTDNKHSRYLGGPAQLSVGWSWDEGEAVTVYLYALVLAPSYVIHSCRLSLPHEPACHFLMPAQIVGAQERHVKFRLEYDDHHRLQLRADIPVDTDRWYRDVLGTDAEPQPPEQPLDPDGPDAPDAPGWSPFYDPEQARGFSIANPHNRYRIFDFLWLCHGSFEDIDRSRFIQVEQWPELPALPLLSALEQDRKASLPATAIWTSMCATAKNYMAGEKGQAKKDHPSYPFVTSLADLDHTWRCFVTLRQQLLQLRGEVSLDELDAIVAAYSVSPEQIVEAENGRHAWIRVWQSVIALILGAGDANYAENLINVLRTAAFVLDLHARDVALSDEPARRLRLMAAAVIPANALPPSGAVATSAHGSVRALGIGLLQAIYKDRERYTLGPLSRTATVLRGERRRASSMEESTRIEQVEQQASQTSMTTQDADQRQSSDIEGALRATIDSACHERDFNDLNIVYNDIYMPQSVSGAWSDSRTDKLREQSQVTRLAQELTQRAARRLADSVQHTRSLLHAQRRQSVVAQDIDNREANGHLNGLYHWLIKRSRLCLENEGQRLVIEFLLPDPAASLVHAVNRPAGVALKPPPTLDELSILAPTDITADNYLSLTGAYGIEYPPPPPNERRLSLTLTGQACQTQGSIDLPDGFVPATTSDGKSSGSLSYLSADQNDVLACIVGNYASSYGGSKPDAAAASASAPAPPCAMIDPFKQTPLPAATPLAGTDANIPIDPLATQVRVCAFSHASSFSVSLSFTANDSRYKERLQAWQLGIYHQLLSACIEQRRLYQQAWTTRVQQQLEPSERACLVNQLQRGAIDLLAELYHSPPGIAAPAPPRLRTLMDEAFQWRQMAYAFFPWGVGTVDSCAAAHWRGLDSSTHANASVLNAFLNAGSARVLVPVTPGYELAMLYYLSYGCWWGAESGIAPVPEPALGLVAALTQVPPREHCSWWIEEPTALEMLQQGDALPTVDWQPPGAAYPRSLPAQDERP
ncbi:hypothetical protein [Dyella silvatica]|uniref:hypothetical protein n=1 Tax=Dyella silvatica TaxID=2992128 RepID=UPI0022569F37|nr:hypothetical protein [Dyella silvatica]